MKRILCFGDSNTWGFEPGTGRRYDENTRWTGVLQNCLGSDFDVIENGVAGRTTVFEQPFDPYRSGLEAIGPAVLAASPLDLLVIMLGTNDLRYADPQGSARGVACLVRTALEALRTSFTGFVVSRAAQPLEQEISTRVLIISPIHFHPDIDKINPENTIAHAHEASLEFDKYFRRVAQASGAWYLNAADVAVPSATDGLHMEPESHRALGTAVAQKICEIFSAVGD